jgi:hypothetical protein
VAELDEGDAAHFDGRAPHAVENMGERTARLIIVVTPAAFEPMVRVKGNQPPIRRRRNRTTAAPATGVAGTRGVRGAGTA